MNGKMAALVLAAAGLVIVVLLLTGAIRSIAAGTSFAVALVVLGLVSGGFRKGRG
jgi:hypothetical protein